MTNGFDRAVVLTPFAHNIIWAMICAADRELTVPAAAKKEGRP